VVGLFEGADRRLGEPDVVVYNAGARARGPITEIDPEAVERAVAISALGGFYVTQQAARRMTPHGRGAIPSHRCECEHQVLPTFVGLRDG
jgi:NAD(P)-dependent dehydrogenase (short-subunit alcohol dehydrogenase family)